MTRQFLSSESRWAGFFLAAAGVVFCLVAARGGAEALCVTDGCRLFKNVEVFGFSLWWWGVANFSILALVLALGWTAFAYMLSMLMLAGDLVLLGVMSLTVACVNCLIVAALLALILLTLAGGRRTFPAGAKILLLLWLFLFSPSVFAVAQEAAGPWPIHGSPSAPLKVFFSPSCPACKETVFEILRERSSQAALYPVAEGSGDYERIQNLQCGLESGQDMENAFRACLESDSHDEEHDGLWERLLLHVRLFRNRVALARMGASKIPLLLVNGRPSGGLSGRSSSGGSGFSSGTGTYSRDSESGGEFDFLEGDSGFKGCSDDAPGDCD